MEIFSSERRVKIAVGEFAAYAEGPEGGAPSSFADPRRARIGTEWHARLRAETAAACPDAEFERTVSESWIRKGWTFEFSGRLDQLIPQTGGMRVREVKSLSGALPSDLDEVRARHPEYLRQLAAYVCLARLSRGDEAVDGELLCVHARTGERRIFPLSGREASDLFERALDRLLVFLEDRRTARQGREKRPHFRPAFAELREGQAQARSALRAALSQAKFAAFEAPTGFGKTGLLLEAGLEALCAGRFSRILYLTGKSTGQVAVTRQLRAMNADAAFRFYPMRNRTEHAIRSKRHTCVEGGRCDMTDAAARWEASGLSAPDIFKDGEGTLARVRELGAKHGLCPYEISRAMLPFADVWVCDYNYVFAPSARGFLDTVFGFAPRDTLLIVDEAHNLPERVCAAYSHALDADALRRTQDVLALARAPRGVQTAAEALARFVAETPARERFDDIALYDFENLVAALDTEIAENFGRMELDDLLVERGDVWDALFAPAAWLEFLQSPTLQKLVWAPRAGEIALTCLDASEEIAKTARKFAGTVFASATLSPSESFARAVGITAEDIVWITAKAPWHKGAFSVAVDARVDTRLSQRERHYETTARTVSALADGASDAVAVFFPSYRYAAAVAAYAAQIDPFLRVRVQPRGLDLTAQQAFLDEALLTAHALFLVLGGGFAESIDALGGKISRAMVVGPSLPEVNPVQDARMRAAHARFGGNHDAAFRAVYQIPAMRKINQALGRLVRAPGQHAKILLHCRRFAEEPYRALLALPVADIPVLRDDGALADWIRR